MESSLAFLFLLMAVEVMVINWQILNDLSRFETPFVARERGGGFIRNFALL